MQAGFSMTALGAVATGFYKLVKSPIEPGQEHSRYSNLRTAFTLTAILGFVFAAGAVGVALLWIGGLYISKAFALPSILGFIAA